VVIKGKRRRSALLVRSIVFGALLLTAFLAFGVWKLFEKERAAKKSAAEMQQRLSELEERRGILAKKLGELETPRGIENEIRETYQVAKAGEQMAVIIDRTASSSASNEAKKGFWGAVLGWFGF
jgi:cell division protein FtsB